MSVVVGVAGIIVGLALLWSGRKRLQLGTFGSALLSLLDIAVLVVSVVLLGWLGVAVFVVTNLVAFLIVSVRLAAKQEEILLYAATQADTSKEEMSAISKWMQNEGGPFALMGPVVRAELISELAQRARDPDEIRKMSHPIALLWAVHRPPLAWLVERFDQLLRLYGTSADDSMRLADTLSSATKHSAATFEQMVEGMVTAALPPE